MIVMAFQDTEDFKAGFADDESPIIGECDCCGAERALTHCWLGNLETFACEECQS